MITIIDYKSGNLRSISNSFKKIGVEAIITSDPIEIENAKHLFFRESVLLEQLWKT